MNREDVIKLAREAGFVVDEASRKHQPKCIGFTHYLIDDELERFAALVAAAEREAFNKERRQYADWFDEAAADIADWGGYASEYFQSKHELDRNVQDFKNRAAAIRSRSKQ